jgi:hypothetical protein
MRNQDSGPAPMVLAQADTPTPAEPGAPDLGFKLPGVGGPTPAPRGAAPPAVSAKNGAPQLEVQPAPVAPVTDTSARDLALGAGVFLVLMVVFFFARNAFTQHLVVRRVAPSAAGSAGWLLFAGLSFLSAAALLALINAGKYLTLAIAGPLLLVGLAGLVGAALVGRR